MKGSNNVDILLITLLSIFCLIIMLFELNNDFLRIISGFIMIMFLPGYSLIAALFPKKNDLANIERIGLSFALSITLTALVGLLLNYTPFGIRLTPILILLSFLTIFMLFIAFLRRKKVTEEERFGFNSIKLFRSFKSFFKYGSGTNKFFLIFVAVLILTAISLISYMAAFPSEGQYFTEFYILDNNNMTSNYPTNLTVGQTGIVNIGIINHENTKMNYKLLIKLNNNTIDEKIISLNKNEKYEKQYRFSPSSVDKKQKMEFLLYKLPDNNNIYRSLHLWINIE